MGWHILLSIVVLSFWSCLASAASGTCHDMSGFYLEEGWDLWKVETQTSIFTGFPTAYLVTQTDCDSIQISRIEFKKVEDLYADAVTESFVLDGKPYSAYAEKGEWRPVRSFSSSYGFNLDHVNPVTESETAKFSRALRTAAGVQIFAHNNYVADQKCPLAVDLANQFQLAAGCEVKTTNFSLTQNGDLRYQDKGVYYRPFKFDRVFKRTDLSKNPTVAKVIEDLRR